MIKNKISKFLACFILVAMVLTLVGQTTTLAEVKNETKIFKAYEKRIIINSDSTVTEKGPYKIDRTAEHLIFQIFSVNDVNSNDPTGTNYYCLKAEYGDTWRDMEQGVAQPIIPNKSYDFVEDKNAIANLSDPVYKSVVETNYGPVMWILDNMYCTELPGKGISTTELLNKAGIVYGQNPSFSNTTCWYYDSDSLIWPLGYHRSENKGYIVDGEDVIIGVAEIEAVQQAAIWHFTNPEDNDFAFEIPEGGGAESYFSIDPAEEPNETKRAMKLEQMYILYNYFVNNAKTKTDYDGKAEGTLALAYTTDQENEKVGDNYRIGPLKATTTNTVNNINIQITPSTGAKVTDANGVEKEFKANEEFYVTIPVANVTNDVDIKVTGKTVTTTKKLWLYNGDKSEQPIIEVVKDSNNLENHVTATPAGQFDLALRKSIVKVKNSNETTKSIVNEAGNSASRTVSSDTSTIPVTAKYQHRKDPVVISTGDIVTYRIAIYNEGDIDGYASKIVDQLPTGMASVLQLDGKVTSHNGNVYKVTGYDTSTNKLELSIDTNETPNVTSIEKFNGTNLKSDYIEIEARVTETARTDGKKQYMTNIAYIAEEYDKDGNKITQDRNGTESQPSVAPNKTADQLKTLDNPNDYKGSYTGTVYDGTDNSIYFPGQEDDDDFEKVVLLPKQFDLALRKFITKINEQEITDRIPVVGTWKYDDNQTLQKAHPKTKLSVKQGDTVVYTIRVYNEGDVDGYASEITDYLPEGLSLKENSEINTTYRWRPQTGNNYITTDYLSKEQEVVIQGEPDTYTKILYAYNTTTFTEGPHYRDLKVECIVNNNATSENLKNIAAITGETDTDGTPITDRDSEPEGITPGTYNPHNPGYDDGIGEQDDDDFEDLKLAEFDVAVRKFITKVSRDGYFENEKTTTTYNRAPQVDSSKLKDGRAKTATYNHSKQPIELYTGDYVLYTIRAYNEGDLDGYASQITDYLPVNLDFVDSTDEYIKGINDKWTYEPSTRKVITKDTAANASTKLKAFDAQNDDGKGSGLSYVDVQIICRINKETEANKKLTNIAEISEYKDENGTVIVKDQTSIQDRDSDSNDLNYPENPETYKDDEINKDYVPGQEDDDDFEKVIVKESPKFDLALRKFITEIDTLKTQNDDTLTPATGFGREPQLSYENGKITYTHPKDVVRTTVGSVVIYTLRVFNEGDVAGYAEEISDDMPEYLEFLPEHSINREYKWVMFDEEGKSTTKVDDAVKIKTDYTSKANGELLMKDNTELKENPNLLNAFDKTAGITDTNPDHVDVKVAFKVKDPNSNTTVIVNKAQISEDADENGNPIDDIDSVPDKWNEGEDDQDYENVAVNYFDLSLLKYVTKAIVTENGKTKTTKTGNNGSKNDITPKVEVYRKSLNKTIVKFEFTIKITNEGDIAGYAKEITDYVPKGLKFYAEDNKGWTDEGNNVISTKLLKDTLLQPGQSATVKVILRWINGENNLGLKTNVAEISEDYNEEGVPDRDSTPDNKKKGEDDIDDAPVLLTISTGIIENTIQYATVALAILVVLGTGLVVIKKYVL